MSPLDPHYKKQLDEVAGLIQASEHLKTYLEEEEEEDYQKLRTDFEPSIGALHQVVAEHHPLQLVSFEEELLDEKFEGLFLPRILGYSVLRGEVGEHYRYVRPQPHFKKILLSVCRSSNFDTIKKRMGQTIQTGFALSSDIEMLAIYGSFMNIEEGNQKHFANALNNARKNITEFDEKWMKHLLFLYQSRLPLNATADLRIYESLDKDIKDQLTELYKLTNTIHTKGYTHPDAVEAVKVAYAQHEGVSTFNSVIRKTIFVYIDKMMSNLDTTQYAEWMDLSKIFPTYIDIFGNQQFNQNIKDLSMAYVKKLLKVYVDKRGRDYQDIKKFVARTFKDLGFLKDKQIVELFKSKRKKRKVEK